MNAVEEAISAADSEATDAGRWRRQLTTAEASQAQKTTQERLETPCTSSNQQPSSSTMQPSSSTMNLIFAAVLCAVLSSSDCCSQAAAAFDFPPVVPTPYKQPTQSEVRQIGSEVRRIRKQERPAATKLGPAVNITRTVNTHLRLESETKRGLSGLFSKLCKSGYPYLICCCSARTW